MTRNFVPCAGLALLATLGCASGKPAAINTAPPVTVTPVTQRVITTGGGQLNINTVSVNSGMTVQILAPIDSAWPALQAVYRELGIPVTTLQDASHLIGNETFKTRRRISKLPMQRILNCGESQGMPNAETYDIMMSISSYFVKHPTAGYNLITRIDATGKSPNYSREASVNCSSQGELEQLISEMVKKKTGS
ncbi:MAG: hypothetical protein NTW72_16090 [Gemmatimonadetes bacterium]|nr:hypothetical protein [Gemmatimonadota bacterium]